MSMDKIHAQRISSAIPPPSGRKPLLNIAPRQVNGLADDLREYHSLYSPLFQRKEQRHWALKYMEGQMLDIERKSIEPMAQALDGGNVQAMQQFTSAGPWYDEPIIWKHQKEAGNTLGHADGVAILDGCDFPKQGNNSVGVSRQHCGPLGKTANCQASVLLAYASDHGHTLLDRRLYIPEKWFQPAHAELRKACDVPAELNFQTKNELGWAMLESLIDNGDVPFQWVTMDEAFGRDTELLNKIDEKNKYYFAEIPCSTLVWQRRPKVLAPEIKKGPGRPQTKYRISPDAPAAKRVDEYALTLRRARWRRVIIREGSKGPMVVEIAIVRVVFSEKGLPSRNEWLIVRRKSPDQRIKDWKFYRSNAPANTSWKKLARLTAWRWPIESTIEECKGELGMDHYEVRNWRGWHHHMTMTMLSHHFLVRMRVKMGDDAPALTVSQMRQLLQVVLPKRKFDAQAVLEKLNRIQQQNYAAYLSHRKRQGLKEKHPT